MSERYVKYSDEDLLELMRRHDDELAFDELYHRYVHQLMQTAVRKTGDSAVAEDLVQELFVKFWINRHKCTIQKSLPAYLHGMLRNYVVTYYYQEQAKHPRSLDEAKWITDENTSEQIQYNILNDFYEQSLQKLPEKCRQVFVLSRKGYSLKEIAQLHNISDKTAEAHISKALRILRVEMKDYIATILIISTFFSLV
ncbi:RNA polymerase sigma factor [Telluribacter sp.]|uniref:RNA polymerase sigma factor n=1 Tax=Telluribacter sp. TaxID=1978767 RepID=UPI002E155FEC|nr:sigma-70 family RNA polymerase sigma factor [Telluribacter sp.]